MQRRQCGAHSTERRSLRGTAAPEDGVAINMDIWTPYRTDFGQFTAYQTDEFSGSPHGAQK
jgi:hypothetical protein